MNNLISVNQQLYAEFYLYLNAVNATMYFLGQSLLLFDRLSNQAFLLHLASTRRSNN
jgi:hypothetical protein